jgi:sulfur-oxidizing protein SoxY
MTHSFGAVTRRHVVRFGAGALVALALATAPASATPSEVDAEIRKRFGDRKMQAGKITLDLPTIAENGNVVPLNFEVESPMTEADYVKGVHFYAEGNPAPFVADYHFTPDIPKAAAQMRIRLAQSQYIVAVAEMSDGQLYMAKQEVKVTIGGCGG